MSRYLLWIVIQIDAGGVRILVLLLKLCISSERVRKSFCLSNLLGDGVTEVAGTLMLESKEKLTVREVGTKDPFAGSDGLEPPINVAVAGSPLYMGGTVHSPSAPAGPASTGTGRPLLSISAMITHQPVPLGITEGFAFPPAAYGYPWKVGGGTHSPPDPAGPPATGTGVPFRFMSATVTHRLTSAGMLFGGGIAVVLAKTTVIAVVFTVTVLGPVAGWSCAGKL